MLSKKICSEILMVRKRFGKRRSRLLRRLAISSRLLSRRERARRGRATSMRLIKAGLLGELLRGDQEDRDYLNRAARENKVDVERALTCLREATQYMDDVVENPNLRINARYRHWEISLDQFLLATREMMEVRKKPKMFDTRLIDNLAWRLSQMKIHECLSEQIMMRWKLEEALRHLFDDTEERFRMAGL